jgi:hypothetical protein
MRRQQVHTRGAPDIHAVRAQGRDAERTARLQAITAALSRAVTREEVARTLVERAVSALGAHEGSVWALEAGGEDARLVFSAGLLPDVRERWQRIRLPGDAPSPLAEVLARGEPVFVGVREGEVRWVDGPRGNGPPYATEQAFACLTLEAERRVVGCVRFGFRGPHRFDYDDQVFLVVVARLAAQALLRAQLYDSERAARAEAEAERQRATFLGEASAILASSLEWEATLASVAKLAVPGIADWCTVEVPETLAPGAPPVAVAHVDPAKVERALAWRRRWPLDPEAAGGPPRVIRTGRSELREEISDAMLVAATADDDLLRIARELGATSAMVVPLSARGRTLGAITFVAGQRAPCHSRDRSRFALHRSW